MLLLSAEKIEKSYGIKPLLEGASLYLSRGDKVGVVGLNGMGKSTLLKIIAGVEQYDSGSITKIPHLVIHYLPQQPDMQAGNTVLQQVFLGASEELRQMKEYEAKSILTKLGISDFQQDVSTLSGGQKKRVAIASALATPCDLLILDEPTNHLDHHMVAWLEQTLQKFRGALLMITHDRYFLDRVSNKILEVNNGQIYQYESNYSGYLESKAQREEMALSSERKRQSLLRKELQWIQRGVKARGTKSRSRVERFEALREKETPELPQQLEISSVGTRLGKKTIEVNHISKSYGDKVLIQDFSYIVPRNGRIGIIGENGCGKSTLLQLLSGNLSPDTGTVEIGDTVKIGYYTQECKNMDEHQRVIDYIKDGAEWIETINGKLSAAQMLETFLFRGDMQWNYINKLSGGERRRLYLLRVLMEAPNVLILDEPTSSLDDHEVEKLFVLMRQLKEKGVAIVFVTHFLEQVYAVCDRITVLRNGILVGEYPIEELPRVKLVAAMMGKDFDDLAAVKSEEKKDFTNVPVVIDAQGMSHKGKIKPFDLQIHKGEVVGLTGLLGSGRSELARVIYGADKNQTGKLFVNGKEAKINAPIDAMNLGMGLLPDDRKAEGIVADLSVRENIILAIQAKQGILKKIPMAKQCEIADKYIDLLQIKCASRETLIKQLSGGNQQKVILARWLATNPDFLILDEPTRGIDIGTKTEIQKLVLKLADEGKSLIFISSEIEEMLRTCNRMAVLRDGQKVGEIDEADMNQMNVMKAIAGGEQ